MPRLAATGLRAHQRGAALLILLAIVSTAIIYAVVAGLNHGAGDLARARDLKTYAALAQAKEALIAYAVTNAENPSHTVNLVPGFLPCPEMVGTISYEGVAPSSCGTASVSQLGRLPWRTLGLDAIRDSSGECLWYAVSGTYKYTNLVPTNTSTATTNIMNWDTIGQFEVMTGDPATYVAGAANGGEDTRAVAVIFAPGSALSGQDRAPDPNARICGGNYNAAAYLDQVTVVDSGTMVPTNFNNSAVSGTANAISKYIAADNSSTFNEKHSSTFNDKLVYITRADIWNAVKKRSDFQKHLRALTRRAAECIAMYGTENSFGTNDKRLPWASAGLLSATTLGTYAVNSRFRDSTSYLLSGRLPYRVSNSAATGSFATDNSISSYNSYLFNAWPAYCAYASSSEQGWYDHWKDHLFYAVADSYKPITANKSNTQCGTCLQVNNSGSYAAVVIFAGERLSSLNQSRNTAADKGSIGNYLEDENLTRINANSGSGSYKSADPSNTFNDIVYAIDANLRVQCYSGGAMVMQNSTPQTGIPASAPAPVAPPGAPQLPPGPVGPYAACP